MLQIIHCTIIIANACMCERKCDYWIECEWVDKKMMDCKKYPVASSLARADMSCYNKY
jgi:hypothetical protein